MLFLIDIYDFYKILYGFGYNREIKPWPQNIYDEKKTIRELEEEWCRVN